LWRKKQTELHYAENVMNSHGKPLVNPRSTPGQPRVKAVRLKPGLLKSSTQFASQLADISCQPHWDSVFLLCFELVLITVCRRLYEYFKALIVEYSLLLIFLSWQKVLKVTDLTLQLIESQVLLNAHNALGFSELYPHLLTYKHIFF